MLDLDFNTANEHYQHLQVVEDEAKTAWESLPDTDPDYEAMFEEWMKAERATLDYWTKTMSPLFAALKERYGWEKLTPRRKIGQIAGSQVNYREIKESMTLTLEILWKEKWLDHCELAWAERWLNAAQRFPALLGYLIPALKPIRDVFYVAYAYASDEELRWIAGYEIDRVEDGYDGLCNAEDAIIEELERRGVGRIGCDFARQLDFVEIFGL